MNGEKFYLNLKEEILSFFEKYHTDDYTGSRSSQWTSIMTKKGKKDKYPEFEVIIDKVLKSIYGESVGLSVGLSREYYRIDNIAWKYTESKSGSGIGYQQNYKHDINAHRWKLLAAVEHENNSKDWTDELVKLAYVNCPLRVVISYGDCTDNYKKAREVANEIAIDIELDKFVNTENQEFLLIFGPKKKNIKNIEDPKEIVSKFAYFKWNGISFNDKVSLKEYITKK